MDLTDLLADDGVVLRGGASSKRHALQMIAEAAARAAGFPQGAIFSALLEREALGSTGLGSGVAVPHARLNGVNQVKGVFMRLDRPIAYDGLDDQPVDLIFALLAPADGGAEHLRALAAVSRMLRSAETREHLRQARTTDAIRAMFGTTTVPAAA